MQLFSNKSLARGVELCILIMEMEDDMESENPRATIGGNNPPLTPFESHSANVNDLIDEARNFLDGDLIATQGQADAVGILLDSIRKAKKAADDQRAIEKKPHDDAAKAVQAQWRPLLERCDTAADTAKRALTPWLLELQRQQDEAAKKAREEALAAQEAALKAQREAQASDDLAAAEKAKASTRDAESAQRIANKAKKAKPNASGGARSVGLRTTYRAEVIDYTAFARWVWINRQADMQIALDEIARSEVKGPRDIPGLIVHEDKGVV